MKIKFGAIVVDGRNKIGGHVVSKNHYGAYIRTKVTPANPQTSAQSEERAYLATVAAAWKDLSAADVLAWNAVLDQWKKTDIFGDSHKMTAISLFQMINCNLLIMGESLVSSPPTPVALSDIGASVLTIIASTSVTLQCTLSALQADECLRISATPPLDPGVRYVKNLYRKVVNTGVLTSADLDFTTLYEAKFGDVYPAGKIIYAKVQVCNTTTGQAGVPRIVTGTSA